VADKMAEALIEGQANGGRGADGPTPATARQEWRQNQTIMAIAWRPVEPLPRAMRKIIQVSAQRLAKQEGCHLSFIGVASDHVHLVLQCPRRRKAAWVAHAFKRGIEADIAHRYGTKATLWQKGFLAHPSSEPIGAEALLAYLNH
jgi:REP element-mobilizing transposase RayT